MVNTGHPIKPAQSDPQSYTIEELFIASKTGNAEDCEDAIYHGPHFVAVIDGATTKTERRWNGLTGGRAGALLLQKTFDTIPPDATASQAVHLLNTALQRYYEQQNASEIVQADPVQRITASTVILSLYRKEIWFVGDCQCLISEEHITNNKKIDSITANARSLFLEAEIAQGKTIEDLRLHDTGRDFILPLLKRQLLFQNKPSTGQYWYPAIDGFYVPPEGIKVIPIPSKVETVILASDGYPVLKETLQETEQALKEILHEDPLLFRKYKTTKGLQKSNISFDDRAYIKIKLLS
ncbi:glycerophosphoryl diester phosphodiesterase [Thermosporothrix hazakensis]|jgi:glycerophosphoryl diester phosphodiesterase|uniref:Glycerophosphoryl diester phosphodiesterase n=1 Tax=Thermosporothrix hazakensis TaxID=644383 RepID=A0A326TZL0_THEHA|nr:hypothetical protein [Thermosporothrix hazakensis]PZW22167.1 glycerophosphoryl diester phosphodiesterase [Thermosporothrix hazakensis]GCE48110.1 hypothetical protein KTH_29790 [Thermosporothrix hazakensis]